MKRQYMTPTVSVTEVTLSECINASLDKTSGEGDKVTDPSKILSKRADHTINWKDPEE